MDATVFGFSIRISTDIAIIQFDDHSFRDNLAGKSEDDPHSNC